MAEFHVPLAMGVIGKGGAVEFAVGGTGRVVC